MTFQELYSFILEATSRPTTFTAKAKMAVNLAVKQALNLHQFSYNKDFETVTYTASSETVNWRSLLASAHSIASVMEVSSNGAYLRTLPVVAFDKLLAEFKPASVLMWDSEAVTTEQTQPRQAFLIQDKLGLYPKPSTNVLLKVIYYKKLVDLSGDSDTNFLTEYCSDLIIDLALQRFNYFLKEDERYPVTEAQIKRSLTAAQQWDSNVVNNTGIDW